MTYQHNELLLTVSELSFAFEDERQILDRISFNIHEGETLLVLGPSGSGKSTLAYCLNNIYPEAVDGILDGTIQFRGRNTSAFLPGEVNQKIGLVLQDPDAQFCMLTVEDEIAFVLENIRYPRNKIAERIDWALQLVDMILLKNRRIHSLSGGQKQKLAVACALAMEPELLILDEPTANLDPMSSAELIETLRILKMSHPFSILVIEHNLDNWLSITDRCIMINDKGQLIFDGEPRECFSGHAAKLAQEGIWLPKPVEAALELKSAGQYDSSKLPLTIDELISELNNPEEAIRILKSKGTKNKPAERRNIFQANKIDYIKHDAAILHNLSVSIDSGEFIAIAGSNGSGKTTFSRSLTGLLPISNGSITFDGIPLDLWKEEDKWRRIGYVFQNPEHQFIKETVFEEIQFSLNISNPANLKVPEIANQLNLALQLNNHPFSLSQGQKRRLSVAVMLLNGQEVVILDEPTFGQDANTARELMHWVISSSSPFGCKIMITHDMDLIDQYADKVLVLHKGSKLFFGGPADLWENEEILSIARLSLPFREQVEKSLKKGGAYAFK